jgi:hypothetical protein
MQYVSMANLRTDVPYLPSPPSPGFVLSFVGKQVFTLAARMDGTAARSLWRVDSRQGSEPWSLQLPKTHQA